MLKAWEGYESYHFIGANSRLGDYAGLSDAASRSLAYRRAVKDYVRMLDNLRNVAWEENKRIRREAIERYTKSTG
ncbi:MAG TPA: hypothetical protein VM389_05305, partial [Phycisphaerae bacterium]|nr:hypothetical protein [Phycisphaerae bacterium]